MPHRHRCLSARAVTLGSRITRELAQGLTYLGMGGGKNDSPKPAPSMCFIYNPYQPTVIRLQLLTAALVCIFAGVAVRSLPFHERSIGVCLQPGSSIEIMKLEAPPSDCPPQVVGIVDCGL
ncbi:unnamed protein product [Calypogeia fissa]